MRCFISGVGRAQDAALEAIGAEHFAHDVDVDEVEHRLLEFRILVEEFGGGDGLEFGFRFSVHGVFALQSTGVVYS